MAIKMTIIKAVTFIELAYKLCSFPNSQQVKTFFFWCGDEGEFKKK